MNNKQLLYTLLEEIQELKLEVKLLKNKLSDENIIVIKEFPTHTENTSGLRGPTDSFGNPIPYCNLSDSLSSESFLSDKKHK